jgi:hypothetical protein
MFRWVWALRYTADMFSQEFGWKPIDTAPIDQDLILIVRDGLGEP